MNEKEYTKRITPHVVVAKRGYVYFLYDNEEQVAQDDANSAKNLERIRAGLPVFNRCYDGIWFACSRSYREIKEQAEYIESLYP